MKLNEELLNGKKKTDGVVLYDLSVKLLESQHNEDSDLCLSIEEYKLLGGIVFAFEKK